VADYGAFPFEKVGFLEFGDEINGWVERIERVLVGHSDEEAG
jgi:hypothetical protein